LALPFEIMIFRPVWWGVSHASMIVTMLLLST